MHMLIYRLLYSYLRDTGCTKRSCEYGHDYELTDGEMKALGGLAKENLPELPSGKMCVISKRAESDRYEKRLILYMIRSPDSRGVCIWS